MIRRTARRLEYATMMLIVCVILPCLGIGLVGAIAMIAEPHRSLADPSGGVHVRYRAHDLANGQGEVCFPARKWNANDDHRPCVYLAIAEDGSAWLDTQTADGNRSYHRCIIAAFDGGADRCVYRPRKWRR